MDGVSVYTGEEKKGYRLHRRFDRMARLTGDPGMAKLMDSFVIIFGLGGVGSFTAEALARSGVGRLRIVDFDEVCVTNVNRQLHALKGNIGKSKATLMGERLALINPTAKLDVVHGFYQESCAEEMLEGDPDFVVDAIDHFTAKCHLIATCKARSIPLVSSMGAAGRWDPTRIQVADLNKTHHDAMATKVRKILREKYAFSRGRGPWGIPAVFSDETLQPPMDLDYDQGTGFQCVCPQGNNGLLTCDRRARIDGSASFVTGSFGLTAASVVVKSLVGMSTSANANA